MRNKLNEIRSPARESKKKNAVFTIVCAFAGVLLGVFSKWLDELALDPAVWWHKPIEKLDLGNFFSDFAVWLLLALVISVFSASALKAALRVFLFFAGMCGAYHLYTIVFGGFDPSSYMMIWYGITLISPLLAVLCWYAKGKGAAAVILSAGITAVFFLSCFGMGFFYVDLRGPLYLPVFLSSVAVLFKTPKRLLVTLPAGFAAALLMSPILRF